MKKITLVGCGLMGKALGKQFIKAGHELHVVDLNEESFKELVELNAKGYTKLTDAPETDVIVLNLPNDNISMRVLEGTNIEGKIIVNTTTNTPMDAKNMQKLVSSNKGFYIDAKIEGYPVDVESGEVGMLYCGDKDAYEKVKDILVALSSQPFYLGENITAASVIDLALVNTHYGVLLSFIEGIALSIKSDYSVKQLADIVIPMANQVLPTMLNHVKETIEEFDGSFADAEQASMNIEKSGHDICVRAFTEAKVNTNYTNAVNKIIEDTINAGYENKGFGAVISQMLRD